MRRRKHKIGLLLLIIFGAILLFSPLFDVRKVKLVETNERNSNFDPSYFEIDENFFLFNASKYEKKLLDTGLIERIEVDKQFFCDLELKITWKKPLISVRSGDSDIILDSRGYVLYISESNRNLDRIDGVIVKSARIGEPVITENDFMLENAVNLYLLILENKALFANPALEAKIAIKNNCIVQVLGPEFDINYGDGSDIKERFSKALSIYNSLYEKQVTSGTINVSRKNHYVYETWKEE